MCGTRNPPGTRDRTRLRALAGRLGRERLPTPWTQRGDDPLRPQPQTRARTSPSPADTVVVRCRRPTSTSRGSTRRECGEGSPPPTPAIRLPGTNSRRRPCGRLAAERRTCGPTRTGLIQAWFRSTESVQKEASENHHSSADGGTRVAPRAFTRRWRTRSLRPS